MNVQSCLFIIISQIKLGWGREVSSMILTYTVFVKVPITVIQTCNESGQRVEECSNPWCTGRDRMTGNTRKARKGMKVSSWISSRYADSCRPQIAVSSLSWWNICSRFTPWTCIAERRPAFHGPIFFFQYCTLARHEREPWVYDTMRHHSYLLWIDINVQKTSSTAVLFMLLESNDGRAKKESAPVSCNRTNGSGPNIYYKCYPTQPNPTSISSS